MSKAIYQYKIRNKTRKTLKIRKTIIFLKLIAIVELEVKIYQIKL